MKIIALFLILLISSCSLKEQVNNCKQCNKVIYKDYKTNEIIGEYCSKSKFSDTVYVERYNERVWIILDSK